MLTYIVNGDVHSIELACPLKTSSAGFVSRTLMIFLPSILLVKCVLYISGESPLNEVLKYIPLIYAILHKFRF